MIWGDFSHYCQYVKSIQCLDNITASNNITISSLLWVILLKQGLIASLFILTGSRFLRFYIFCGGGHCGCKCPLKSYGSHKPHGHGGNWVRGQGCGDINIPELDKFTNLTGNLTHTWNWLTSYKVLWRSVIHLVHTRPVRGLSQYSTSLNSR